MGFGLPKVEPDAEGVPKELDPKTAPPVLAADVEAAFPHGDDFWPG